MVIGYEVKKSGIVIPDKIIISIKNIILTFFINCVILIKLVNHT